MLLSGVCKCHIDGVSCMKAKLPADCGWTCSLMLDACKSRGIHSFSAAHQQCTPHEVPGCIMQLIEASTSQSCLHSLLAT